MNEKTTTVLIVLLIVAVIGIGWMQLSKAPASIVTTTWNGEINAAWVTSADTVGKSTGVVVNDTLFNMTSMAAFDTGYATMKIEVSPNVKDIVVKTEQATGATHFLAQDFAVVESDPDATSALVQATSIEKINDKADIRATITYEFTKSVDVFGQLTFNNDQDAALGAGALSTVKVSAGQADRDHDEVLMYVIK